MLGRWQNGQAGFSRAPKRQDQAWFSPTTWVEGLGYRVVTDQAKNGLQQGAITRNALMQQLGRLV